MAYVVTRRALIGEWREPGYVCSSDDLQGRDVRRMEDKERTVRWDPTVDEPQRTVKDDGDEDLDLLSRSDLNARAEKLGVEDADKLPNKAAVIEAIQAAEDESSDED